MSDITVESLQIEIEMNSEQAVNGIKKLTATLDKLKNAVKGGAGLNAANKQIEKMNKALAPLNAPTEKLSAIADSLNAISKIGELKISSSIATQINKIGDAMNNLQLSGVERLEDTASALECISGIGMLPVSMPTANGIPSNPVITDTPTMPGADAINNVLNGVTQYNSETVRATQQTMNWSNAIRNLPSEALQKLSTFPASIGRAFASAGEKIKSFAGKLNEVIGAKVKIGFSKISNLMKNFGKETGSSNSKLGRFWSRVQQIVMYRALCAMISGLTSAIKEGISNLYQFSKMLNGNFAASLDRCATAFQYLKNSAGAMVAPLINALAPALDFIIDKIATLFNYVNMLFARLSSASVYTVAKKQAVEYAEVVGDSAGKAAKDIKNALLGFDELNVISPNEDLASGSGSTIPDFGSMFEEIPIPENVSTFFDRLKAAFDVGDWKALGTTFGEKVNEWVDSVDWEGAGRKIGYYINGAIQTAYSFLKTVDFKNISSNIATMLNAALEGIDFTFVGRLLVQGITVGLDFLIGLLGSLNWNLIGKSIGDFLKGAFTEAQAWLASYDWSKMASELYSNLKHFITGLDFAGIASSFFKMLGSAIAATVSFVGTFIKEVVTDIGNYFKQYIQNDDGTYLSGMDLVKGLLNGIWDGIKNIGAWIRTNVFDPFIKGFKEVFGIHSPSTVMAKIGAWIVEGFMQGLNLFAGIASKVKEWAGAVVEWFKEKCSYDSFYQLAANVIDGFKNGIRNMYRKVKDSITTWGSSIFDWFGDVLGINSPSKVFYEMGGFAIEGFNNAFDKLGKTTQGIVGKWANSFTSIAPQLSLSVDTSSLKYYESAPFGKSISASLLTNSEVTMSDSQEEISNDMRQLVGEQNAMLRKQNQLMERLLEKDGKVVFPTSVEAGRAIRKSISMYDLAGGNT